MLSRTKKANNAKHSKTKLPWLVTFYGTQPGNEVGLFCKAPEPKLNANYDQQHKNLNNMMYY